MRGVEFVSIEGTISLAVDWDGRQIKRARVVSTRPREVARVLVGRRAAEAVAMVPRLFSICGRSQAVAAALACECAAEIESDPAVQRSRRELVDAELAHEYLWRILLDWPRAVGEPGDAPLLATVRARLTEAIAGSEWAMRYAPDRSVREASTWDAVRAEIGTLLADNVLQAPRTALEDAARFDAWLAAGQSPVASILARLRADSAEMGAPGVPLLPMLTPELAAGEVARRLDGDELFCAAPDWEGSPRETGARARRHAHPLVAELTRGASSAILPRFAARLVELVELLEGRPGAGMGSAALQGDGAIAWVETARGVLIHRVVLDADRVARYQIVAPTEWNFHPRGALAIELETVRGADRAALERRIDLLVQSLDPCVAYSVEVGHA
jgi:uptake hydrogenase large subunit